MENEATAAETVQQTVQQTNFCFWTKVATIIGVVIVVLRHFE